MRFITLNVIIKVQKSTINYFFLVIPDSDQDKTKLSDLVFFYNLLYPFFSRLAHIFNFRRVQSIMRKRNYRDIAKKVSYVNNAVNSMHFTRNKLGPLKTYLSMVEDYNSQDSEEKKAVIKPFIEEERKRVNISLDLILDRANSILEKQNNPFNVLDGNNFTILRILSMVRETSSLYLRNENFDFILDASNINFKKEVTVNETGFELVLSNWFSNVSRYKSSDKYGVIINDTEDHFYLRFFNNFTNTTNNGTPDFVEDFNSTERMAILKRKTHGLIEIKDFLEQMDIKSKMEVDNDMLYFELQFLKK